MLQCTKDKLKSTSYQKMISDSRVEASQILRRAQADREGTSRQASEPARQRASQRASQQAEGHERFASKQALMWPQSSAASGGTSR